MGLFGLLATLIAIGIFATNHIQHVSADNKNKDEAKKSNSITYADSYGYDHLTSTGEKVCYTNGKIYSLKTPNRIIYDPKKQYYEDANKKLIEDAKKNNRKYVFIYYLYDDTIRCCKTELSTMKKIHTTCDVFVDWKYFKEYIEYEGSFLKIKECIMISKQEYEELGGYVPRISAKEYLAQKTKEAKRINKILEDY